MDRQELLALATKHLGSLENVCLGNFETTDEIENTIVAMLESAFDQGETCGYYKGYYDGQQSRDN